MAVVKKKLQLVACTNKSYTNLNFKISKSLPRLSNIEDYTGHKPVLNEDRPIS